MYNHFREIVVGPHATIREALTVIENGTVQAALVMGASQRLEGVVTDGDIRRALLAGATLDDSIENHYQRKYRSVSPEIGRSEALDLLKVYRVEQLPIVDEEGRLVGLHLLSDLIGGLDLPNWAVILAGGKGTRLGELTKSTPKPMLKVAGRPILERIVLHLVGSGIKKIYLSVNHFSEVIEEHFGNGEQFGCEIEYIRESFPMGSGGSLSLLPSVPEHPILVMNGDLVSDFGVGTLFRQHASAGAAISIGVKEYSHTVPFGCVVEEAGVVKKLEEKPTLRETISTGIYAISPELLSQVPSEFFPITELIHSAMDQKKKVVTYRVNEWIDVGSPSQLAEARTGDS